jgi:hypothetical protein
MLSRDELIHVFALDVMADDYENLEQVYQGVSRLASRCGMAVEPHALKSAVDQAVVDSVQRGLAKAYRLSPTAPVEEIDCLLHLGQVQDLYFFITDEGRQLVSSYAGWPFDENCSLLPGWSLPPE